MVEKEREGVRVKQVEGTHFPNTYKVEKADLVQKDAAFEKQKKELQDKL